MNFEHVCGNMLVATVVCGVCLGCVVFVEYCDGFVMTQGRKMLYIKICMIGSVVASVEKVNIWQSIGLGIVFGTLLFACITDYTQCQVYCFIWWIAGSVVIVWLAVMMSKGEQIPWLELVVFCIIQELLFSKLYGKADCHAFCVCAVMYALLEKGMLCYLLHMALSLLLLTCVQWRRGNITRSANLKIPVPFIPYIVLAFLLLYLVITCEIFPLNKYSH